MYRTIELGQSEGEGAPMTTKINYADTDAERQHVRDFLAEHIPGIASNAVPRTGMDGAYAPLVPLVRGEGGEIVAAALTCRSQLAAGASLMPVMGGQYAAVMDKHSELDLLAVAEGARGQGFGTLLVRDLEARLAERGVRVWFGNVTHDNDAERLRSFYSQLGFTVLDEGQPLPPLLGRNWVPPGVEPPAFFFYKTVRGDAATSTAGVSQ